MGSMVSKTGGGVMTEGGLRGLTCWKFLEKNRILKDALESILIYD